MGNTVTLDVREMLRAKNDPFEVIMAEVEKLGEKDVLELITTFEPKPLHKLMGSKGFQFTFEEVGPEHYITKFYRELVR